MFNITNRYTVSAIFRRALGKQEDLPRRRTVGADMILSYVGTKAWPTG